MKYTKVWSDEFLSEVKREMKQNSIYFRIVKQGSMLTYLTLHIFTIFVILLMATMRQSLLSLIYVFMLLP
jgi:sRNA-binding regulator protein Hfq